MFDGSFTPEARCELRKNAKQFLAAVNNCSETEAMNLPLTWQIFPEAQLLRQMDVLEAQILHGSLAKKWPTLLSRNEDGFHIGLCTSRMQPSLTGKPVRDKQHVASFHYLAVDIDLKDRDTELHPDPLDPIGAVLELASWGSPWCPTVIVDSGHGYHLYYTLAEPQQSGRWPSVLRARLGLWQHFQDWGADKSCALDPTKTLRVPGTQNLKYQPVPCRVLQVRPTKVYALEDLIEAFPYVEPIKPEIQHSGFIYTTQMPEKERVQMAYEWLIDQPPAYQGSGGSVDCMSAAWVGPRFFLDKDVALELMLRFYNPQCVPEWSESELRHKLDSAYESAEQKGLMGCGMPDFRAKSDRAFIRNNTDILGGVDDAE